MNNFGIIINDTNDIKTKIIGRKFIRGAHKAYIICDTDNEALLSELTYYGFLPHM